MKLSSLEVAKQIRKGLCGEIPIKLAVSDRDWLGTYAGDVSFKFGDWEITFFNDCDELDYTDNAKASDGRTANYEEWCTESTNGSWCCPLSHLSVEEQNKLQSILEEATP